MYAPASAVAAYNARDDLQKYEDNGLLLFALQLRFGIEDIDTVAADALTDGADDKKCDLVHVDLDEGRIVVAQGYAGRDETKSAAPANKASDLNTAVTWLLMRELDELPDRIRPAAKQVREAIRDGQIRTIELWYVHNLPESANVKDELTSAVDSADAALKRHFSGSDVSAVTSQEVGRNTLEEWYQSLTVPILVGEEFQVTVPGGYLVSGEDWESFSTAVPLSWLRNAFHKHKTNLFSANVREYLGSRNDERNINNGIKNSASEDPQRFWVYNNGLTVLVHDFAFNEDDSFLKIQGMSIVNGAQTTGAVGSLEDDPGVEALVPSRFVKCNSDSTIKNIIKFNNSQNNIKPADFRSNDHIQKRLIEEFTDIPDSEYSGGRRGGYEDIIRRTPNVLPSDTVAQSLAAFHLDPVIAYNRKSKIWLSNELYDRFFNEKTTASHIVFCYSLLKAVEVRKRELMTQSNGGALTAVQEAQLEFLRSRGAIVLLATSIANSMETILDRPLPDRFAISFGTGLSADEAIERWEPIVEMAIAFVDQIKSAIERGLNNRDDAMKAADLLRSLLEAVKPANKAVFDTFSASARLAR